MDIYTILKTIIAKHSISNYGKDTINHSYKMATIAKSVGAPAHFITGLLLYCITVLEPKLKKWLQIAFKNNFLTDFAKYNNVVKIMLCYKDPTYYKLLSAKSKSTYIKHYKLYINSQHLTDVFNTNTNIYELMTARYCYDLAGKVPTNTSINFNTFKTLIYNPEYTITKNDWQYNIKEYQRLDFLAFMTKLYNLNKTPNKVQAPNTLQTNNTSKIQINNIIQEA